MESGAAEVILLKNMVAINLRDTLSSGQTFAFVNDANGYTGVVDGRACHVCEADGVLSLRCQREDEMFWRLYFGLEGNGKMPLGLLPDDPALPCVRAFQGLRLLHQPVWETVCEFILSANNHQRRIESIYAALSGALGETVHFEGRTLYAFPSPERLAGASEGVLRSCGAGYRARYLLGTAAMVHEGFSLDLDSLEYQQALEHLMRLPGVGEKVADCILLFSTRHGVAFPIDVWMERVMREIYGVQGNKKEIKRQAQLRFGENAGWIQQCLFHGARTGMLPLAGGRKKTS